MTAQDCAADPGLGTDVRRRVAELAGCDLDDVVSVAATRFGYSNRSWVVDVEGERLVAKWARDPLKRADLCREATTLGRLSGIAAGLPTPSLRAHDDRDGLALSLLAHLDAPHGIDVLASSKPDDVLAMVERLSVAVGSLHAATGLIHGDLGIHNTLWDGPDLALLFDWELARPADPVVDLAWLRWTLALRLPVQLLPAALDRLEHACGHSIDEANATRLVRAQMMRLYLRTEPASPARVLWRERLGALGITET